MLLDVRMPKQSGIEACVAIKAASPTTKIIMLTVSDEEADLYEAVKNGASGYLLKDSSIEEVAQGIRVVAEGQSLISPSMAAKLIDEFKTMSRPDRSTGPALRLTERELDVLRLVAKGLSNRDVAHRLAISENTVKNHVRNMLEKLQLHSRMEAVMYAVREKLVELDVARTVGVGAGPRVTVVQSLSLAQARRIALAAQGFADKRHAAPTMRTFERTLTRTGVLQVDSVNVLQRAHYMPLYSRMGPYDVDLLRRAARGPPAPRGRVLGARAGVHAGRAVAGDAVPDGALRRARVQVVAGHRADAAAERVLKEVESRGPVTARELDDGTAAAPRATGAGTGRRRARRSTCST